MYTLYHDNADLPVQTCAGESRQQLFLMIRHKERPCRADADVWIPPSASVPRCEAQQAGAVVGDRVHVKLVAAVVLLIYSTATRYRRLLMLGSSLLGR